MARVQGESARRMPRARWRAAALAAALLVAAACRSAGPISSSAEAPAPRAPAAPSPLELADGAYSAADYPTAAAAYAAYLTADPDGADADRALFQLGLVLLLPDNRAADPAAAHFRLRTLLERFPASPYAPYARSLLALLDEIGRLRAELRDERGRGEALQNALEAQRRDLEALKRIDLGSAVRPPAP